MLFFFFKQKTAYEMRISDWSSDVCSSDLSADRVPEAPTLFGDGHIKDLPAPRTGAKPIDRPSRPAILGKRIHPGLRLPPEIVQIGLLLRGQYAQIGRAHV